MVELNSLSAVSVQLSVAVLRSSLTAEN